jgi:hypothetical protein
MDIAKAATNASALGAAKFRSLKGSAEIQHHRLERPPSGAMHALFVRSPSVSLVMGRYALDVLGQQIIRR